MIKAFPYVLMRAPVQSLRFAYDFPLNIPLLLQEGIYLSSEAFWNELQKKENLPDAEKEKLQLSFLKYNIRSSSRCTPYGTFAGSTLVQLTEEETRITLCGPENHIRKIRIDMNYMTEIINSLMALPAVKEAVKLFPNNSIYELSGSYRYAQYHIKNNTRHYELTSIEKTDYLKSVLAFAESGVTINDLSMLLMDMEDVSRDEADEFITGMYASQLLVADLEPCVTGQEPLDNLIVKLEELGKAEDVLTQLKKIQTIITEPGDGVEHYRNIEKELKKLNINIVIPKNTIQTDLFLAVKDNHLSIHAIQTIIDQHVELYVLTRKSKNQAQEDFKSRFLAKYENEEIPLALALDVEMGIGYAGNDQTSIGENAMINDLVQGNGNFTQPSYQFDHIQRYIHGKYLDFLEKKKELIELTETELSALKTNLSDHHYANSFYLFGSFLKGGPDFTFDLSVCAGPSAGNLLARFTHGDAGLRELTKEILKQEEDKDKTAIYAEVAHLPQARIGNVLLRPVLRKYEIPYVGKSGIAVDNQIPINDILVSVRNDEILLRSIKHNKRIIPRLTTAHNFVSGTLPVYRFLGDLQFQKLSTTHFWDWGVLSSLSHLPRVVYKNLIITKARWKIERSTLTDLPGNREEYIAYFKEYTGKLKIPRRVSYIEGDNKLFIDFGQLAGIELLLHYLKRYGSIVIEEFLFAEDDCIVKDIAGNPYTNEFIIPLHRQNTLPERVLTAPFAENGIKRKFSPYSEWLYFKIYCGPTIAEELLRTEILEFVESGIEKELFEKFFFLRYKDESSHIRIRFFNSAIGKQLLVQQKLMEVLQPLLDTSAIEKVVIDTYLREIERYGENGIEEAEGLFFNDSLAVLKFINLLDGAEFEKYRLLFALRGTDELLNDFNLSLAEKKDVLKALSSNYFREFGGNNSLEKQLNDKYRKQQKEIFSHLNPALDAENEIEEGVFIFKERSAVNAVIIAELLKKSNNNTEGINDVIKSHIHMFINRLFVNNQRKHELVIYHFLERYYTSQFAITRKQEMAN